MIGITKFLESSGMTKQLQDRIVDIIEEYGPEAVESENFIKVLTSFISTVLLSYAISNLYNKYESKSTEDIQDILNNMVQELSPGSAGMLVEVKEDSEQDKHLLDLYSRLSANSMPC